MNPYRGEVEVNLGEVIGTRQMRPTFQNLIAIEKRLGMGLIPLVQKFSRMDVSLNDIAVVVHTSINDPKISFNEVGEAIMMEGVAEYAKPVADFLAGAISAGKKVSASGNGPEASQKA